MSCAACDVVCRLVSDATGRPVRGGPLEPGPTGSAEAGACGRAWLGPFRAALFVSVCPPFAPFGWAVGADRSGHRVLGVCAVGDVTVALLIVMGSCVCLGRL